MRLQTKLFLWFFVGVLCASLTSFIVFSVTRHEPDRAFPRIVALELAAEWDDVAATEAHVRRMRDETGSDLTLIRDPRALPPEVTGAGERAMVPVRGRSFVPIVRAGQVVGALSVKADQPTRWVRPGAGLLVAAIFFLFAARRISTQIARPLERVADAAHRLGAGDMAARANVADDEGIEAQRLGAAFDGMAVRVERLVRDQRELLGAVSHELRSPLGRARVALEIAREREDKDQALDKLSAQLDDVDHILGDLLTVTRVGLSDLRKRRVDLGEWLKSGKHAEATSLVIHGSIPVDIDAELLGRVIANLVGNAKAHGGCSERPPEVDASVVDGRARVAVRDHGVGFSADVLDRAFEPFVRGNVARSPQPTQKGQAPGAGLGLAIVKRIVEAHGGAVTARNYLSAHGSVLGAEVSFELPLAPPTPVA